MKYNPAIHHRRSIRLKGYDYSRAGLYFVTICARNHLCLFGKIENGKMILNESGKIAEKCLLAIPEHYPHAKLHQFVVMPNHIHCIIEITVGVNDGANDGMDDGANDYSPLREPTSLRSKPVCGTSKTVGSIVRGFKIGVTKWFRANTDIHAVWQRNYYEHIIRNEKAYCQISNYIQNNPLKWRDDKYHA